jgi:hypothetical protein
MNCNDKVYGQKPYLPTRKRVFECSFLFSSFEKALIFSDCGKKTSRNRACGSDKAETSNPCYLLLQQKSGIDAPKAADCTNGKRVYTEAVDS